MWLVALLLACGCRAVSPTERAWLTYRHDNARSGVAESAPSLPLTAHWTFQARYAPRPAWDDPKPYAVEGILERRRFHFDDVFQVTSDGDRVYFGSSANNKVYALDARTGAIRWTVNTGGPVRLAPTVWRGRVLVGSDDGFVYCLRAADGQPVWTFHAAPGDDRLLGNGRMISRWPVRTGVIVEDGIAYFGAGIFPAEGVYLYAVRAEDGGLVWRNDGAGETPQSRVSPQGYPLASKDRLFVPMGRASPAAFRRRDGELLDTPYFGKHIGGTFAVLERDQLFAGTSEMMAYSTASSRTRYAWLRGRKIVVTPDVLYLADDHALAAYDRATYAKATLDYLEALNRRGGVMDRINRLRRQKGNAKQMAALQERLKAEHQRVTAARAKLDACRLWSYPLEECEALIRAGDVLFAGTADHVTAVDAETGLHLWTGRVEGVVKGLAVAAGRLYASTDAGHIACFGAIDAAGHSTVTETANARPYPDDALTPLYRKAAETILKESGVTQGYCLVLGAETGRLACELARRSTLMIYAVEPDVKKAERARAALDAAGLLGARVVVDRAPLNDVPYSDYFANLIVSDTALISGELPDSREMFRMLKPLGGVACVGRPADKGDAAQLAAALSKGIDRALIAKATTFRSNGTWAKLTRGALKGAGKWTHQYAEPGNSGCSDDVAVQAPFGLLWFGSPGPGQMMNRHRRAAAPLAMDGRMFIQGENVLMAYDAYNGVKLWERRLLKTVEQLKPIIPRVNVSYEASNFAAAPDSILVAIDDKCHRHDAATGNGIRTYRIPEDKQGRQGNWGYLACDGGLVFGSRARRYATSDAIFALDLATGTRRWIYEGKSIRHATISISGGRVYFLDADVTDAERTAALEPRAAAMQKLAGHDRARAEAKLQKADVRRVVALDAKTGRPAWRRVVDLTGCGDRVLSTICHKGVLLLFGVHLDGHLWKQFFAGQFDSRRVLALNATDGAELWTKTIGYRVRPLVIGDTFHAEPWAFDLRTGKQRTRPHPVTGATEAWQFARPGHHCGCPVASPNSLFFRSYDIAYYDLLGDYGTMHVGSIRPGCWVNVIPANGLVMVPEAGSGCMCPFPNMCTVVFKPRAKQRGWAMYSASGPMTPVRRLAINLGAPGDRKDAHGTLWLGYPRPARGRLVMQVGLNVAYKPGRYFSRAPDLAGIEGADTPWIFSSGCTGVRRLTVPLIGKSRPPAYYTVRLGFAELVHRAPGRRVFDIRLQGKTVLRNLDIFDAAGGRNRAVTVEFKDIYVNDLLRLDLVPKDPQARGEASPVLCSLEVIRTRAFPAYLAPPSYVLSNPKPEQTQQVRIVNTSDAEFRGTLTVGSLPGITFEPASTAIRVPAKGETTVSVKAVAGKGAAAGRHSVTMKLAAAGTTLSHTVRAPVRHFGNRLELVVKAVADTYADQRKPGDEHSTSPTLLVDGGYHEMGDSSHAMAYLRFPVRVPGRPTAVRLRLHVPAREPSAASRDAGRVVLVAAPWDERKVTYKARPAPGREIGKVGAVRLGQAVEVPLNVSLVGRDTLSVALVPTVIDNAVFFSRESKHPPELIIEYEPRP